MKKNGQQILEDFKKLVYFKFNPEKSMIKSVEEEKKDLSISLEMNLTVVIRI